MGENMERYRHTWYSLISDLSKPGIRRVTDLLEESNLTGSMILLLPLAGVERSSRAPLLGLLDMIKFQSGSEPNGRCGHRAKGKGKKLFLTISMDST